jgi:hypothetical protein
MFMMNKKTSTFLASVSTALLLITNPAYAHHPEISAEAICDAEIGSVVINYTSTAWDSGDPASRENARIDISFDGGVVGTGSYEAPDYSFSDSKAAPAGSSAGDVVTVTATAVADWGNGSAGGDSRSTTVTIPEGDCGLVNGRFTGGGHQILVGGVRVTRGLTIHCDLLLSNNLQINWQGNSFHTLEHLTTVACTDDPEIGQAPPPAPLDTLIGTGNGRYNNEPGYSIEFTLVDAGEPGREDQAAFLVYETANPANVVLEVPLQVLTGGNLQAHYDQPHK